MDVARGSAYGVALVVLATAVVSGPLVGGVDLSRDRDTLQLDPGTGSVDFTVAEFDEDGYRIERGAYGSGTYYLVTPDIPIDVRAVEGQPLVNYKVRIEELAVSNVQIHFLGSEQLGRTVLTMDRSEVSGEASQYDSLTAEVRIVVRSDAGVRVAFSRNVTVEVVE